MIGKAAIGKWAIGKAPVTATGAGEVTGTLSATETQDSANFAGNVYITGTFAVTEPQDSAAFSGPVAVSEQTPNRAGGSYTSRKRQKIVLLERVEDVEDFVEQVEQVVKEAPKAKPVLRKVKKLRPQTVENTYDNAQAWVDYYQRMAEALRDREQAAQLKEGLERGAKMLESVLALRETQELLRIAKRREDEELLLMLMAA